MKQPSGGESLKRADDLAIYAVSAKILRIGVVASVAVMVLGLGASFWGGAPTVERMQTFRFSGGFAGIFAACARGDGGALIELGILMLVLTPILRVASSMVLFVVEEKDWFYAAVTGLVLGLTLLSLLILR